MIFSNRWTWTLLVLVTCTACSTTRTPERAEAESPRIVITPSPAMIDEPVQIRVSGLRGGEAVTIRGRITDQLQRKWESDVVVVADGDGNIDLATAKPQAGSYAEADAGGLFWSMKLAPFEKVVSPFRPSLQPMIVSIGAERGESLIASATLERRFVSPGVSRMPLRENGLAGIFFRPPGPGPHPGVVVVGGSGGGVEESRAALLSSHGYAVLALAYFRYEGLPDDLINIPLEYFERAIRWMQASPDVRGDRLALLGISRGAEVSLILASVFPEVDAVVAMVPSVVAWGGVSSDPSSVALPAWSHRGQSLPFLSRELSPVETGKVSSDEPLRLALTFSAALADVQAVERAAIPVEKAAASMLLISTADDGAWPSTRMAEMLMARLTKHDRALRARHIAYSGTGHLVPLPNVPTTVHTTRHRVRGFAMELGGNARDTARAASESWLEILKFLRLSLQ